MNTMRSIGRPVPWLLVVAVAMLGAVLPASPPAMAASRGECVTALMAEPFRLPDGMLYPAGRLTLCDYGTFSPVDSLHRILVGGSSVGLFRSSRRNAETRAIASPEVLFNRDAEGNLELIGYAMATSGHVVAYRMKARNDAWDATARRPVGGSSAPLAGIVATARGR